TPGPLGKTGGRLSETASSNLVPRSPFFHPIPHRGIKSSSRTMRLQGPHRGGCRFVWSVVCRSLGALPLQPLPPPLPSTRTPQNGRHYNVLCLKLLATPSDPTPLRFAAQWVSACLPQSFKPRFIGKPFDG